MSFCGPFVELFRPRMKDPIQCTFIAKGFCCDFLIIQNDPLVPDMNSLDKMCGLLWSFLWLQLLSVCKVINPVHVDIQRAFMWLLNNENANASETEFRR